ncbi:hypothetical protein LB518_00785 [Mesorhizobium sp. BR1-1-16]|uniref:hypothetical protein n=1 Tax=Mesorhizobium sp. BR1-1-16 TaxID=2876653 RepID=UPI001CCC6BF3|nr:hypothetical protein [Mesorhizobium sp. BR1-1-16]MBZ9934814.1 hypothetical protein [Mesorhizobium sp. BR1-1-16]
MQSSSVRGLLIARSPSIVAVALSAALLAACSSIGGGSGAGDATVDGTAPAPAQGGGNMLSNALFGGPSAGKAGAVVLDPSEYQKTVALCPPVSIRPGTEQMTALAAGAKADPITGAPPPVTYQSSIVKTARECRATEGGVAVKVGVIGRTVAGPAGKAGTITVPLRIAVVQGSDKILKSELFKIPVTLTEPNLSTDFTKIDDQIVLPIAPGNSDYRIYVGFDDAPVRSTRR